MQLLVRLYYLVLYSFLFNGYTFYVHMRIEWGFVISNCSSVFRSSMFLFQ